MGAELEKQVASPNYYEAASSFSPTSKNPIFMLNYSILHFMFFPLG